jgi:DNA-binding MarR family transcriptional regulator
MEDSQTELATLRKSLDTDAKEILIAISECDGKPNTTELRDMIGAEHRNRINYRREEILEPRGLVKTSRGESEQPGAFSPILYELTEKGEELVQYLGDGELDLEITDRIDRLEDDVSTIQETLEDLSEHVQEQPSGGGSGSEDLQQRLDELEESVAAVANDMASVRMSPLFDKEMQKSLDTARYSAAACRELLIEEFGEERVKDAFLDAAESKKSIAEWESEDDA